MSEKQIALDLAAFLDSPRAGALEARPEEVRKIVKAFLEACYQDVGKVPRLLDDHDVHEVVGHALPSRMKKKDPLAAHVPAVLEAYFDHLEETAVCPQAYEMRRGLERTLEEFQETVRTGACAHHHHGPKEKPLVHGAPKLGRNDPCFCGSGKKFKKCHGKG